MKLIKATEFDSQRISKAYQSYVFQSSIDIEICRPNFFDYYRLHSNDFVTYILLDDQHEIQAMATLIFKEAWLNQRFQTIGYATDLRVSKNRKAILEWPQHFLPVLEEEQKNRDCEYVFSVLSLKQRQAYNTFIRPRSPKRKLPRYYQFRKFNIVTIHGLIPFAPAPLESIKVRHFKESDTDELVEYLAKNKLSRPLYYNPLKDQLLHSLSLWSNLDLSDFLIAFDSQKNIVGCTAPWSPEKVQQMNVVKYYQRSKSFQEMLKVSSIFGLTHRLPKINQPLHFKYLTHLNANNPDIFYALLHKSFKSASKREFLIYPHFEDHLSFLPPRPFLAAKIPSAFYCLLLPHQTPPPFLKPKLFTPPPELELAFF